MTSENDASSTHDKSIDAGGKDVSNGDLKVILADGAESARSNQEVEGWNHFEISLKIDNDREVYVTKEKIKTSSSRVPLYQITSEPQGAGSDIFVELFIEQVQKAINGDAPWTVLQVPTGEEIKNYLNEFPTYAMPGVGMGDLSIIKEWEKAKERHPYLRVFIWSLDKHLMGYDHQP